MLSTLIFLAGPAYAGSGSGLVRQIFSVNNEVVFAVDAHVEAPACDKFTNQFEFDGSTADGKSKLAILLAAASGGKSLTVVGTGACSVQGREVVHYIAVFY